jgi:hypothetical protein
MKKITLLFSVFMFLSMFAFAQIQDGDLKLLQQYYGTEKMAVVKDYMALTPAQDSVFWDDYNSYESARMELGKRRIQLIEKYAKDLMALNADNATEMINEANAIDVEFKKLQKTYYKKMSKKSVKLRPPSFTSLRHTSIMSSTCRSRKASRS